MKQKSDDDNKYREWDNESIFDILTVRYSKSERECYEVLFIEIFIWHSISWRIKCDKENSKKYRGELQSVIGITKV